MKVILVNGSPHIKGCTHTALEEVAKTLNECDIETEIFWIGAKSIPGCMGCWQCKSNGGTCVYTDVVNLFAEKAAKADGFIFGSPVHFASPAGALLSFMDRLFVSAPNPVFDNKPAAAVVSCRRGGASASFDVLNKYFSIRSMPIVTSQYWNQVHGSTPEQVLKDAEGLQTMRTLARNMAWMLKCIEAGKQSGIASPEREPVIRTDFIDE